MRTKAPAKLNLFLELLRRRDDGYHDIDTVMVPIDWCDDLTVERTDSAQISLTVDWLPSRSVIASRLGVNDPADSELAASEKRAGGDELLQIPEDQGNLVYQALQRFRDRFQLYGGFHCKIGKRIPAGAGMGGASSDAAAAIRCAASLSGIHGARAELHELAASIGSDVPFFLGADADQANAAARARGRGEILTSLSLRSPLHFVVAFPGECLSTAKVYAASQVPHQCDAPEQLISALHSGDASRIGQHLFNRLTEPARKILPRIDEILNSMWRCGLQACQLTGSGSACFAILTSETEAIRMESQLRAALQPGALVSHVRSVCVPSPIVVD